MHADSEIARWLQNPLVARKTPPNILTSLSEEELSDAMGSVRARIYRMLGKNSSASKGAHDAARSLKRKRKKFASDNDYAAPKKAPKNPSRSLIADAIYPDRKKVWKHKKRKKSHLTIRDFSFLDNPKSAFDALEMLIKAECINRNVKLDFFMERCLDIAPLLVLGLMWRDMHRIYVGGKIDPRVSKVMRSVGLDKFLRMRISAGDQKDIWSFPIREKGEHTARLRDDVGGNTRDKVAFDFVESLDNWLGVATAGSETGLELSDDGKSAFQKLVCEILENAERHSVGVGVVGGWACAGFMARRSASSPNRVTDYVCHLAFVNTGQTIAEGLRATEHDRSRIAIDTYFDAQRGWLRRNPMMEEVLLTLMAIQPGVTRKEMKDTTAGGIGFHRILEALHSLMDRAEGEAPEVTIISGSSCIHVRHPYGRMTATKEGWKGLYFNSDNTIYEPPDPRFVSRLTQAFPGTIIAARFLVDPARPQEDD